VDCAAAKVAIFLAGLFTALASVAHAGPPYTTDDPEPTDTGHWEDRVFFDGVQTPGLTTGQSGFDINYGAVKDLQLTLLLPLDYENGYGHTLAGAANIQLSAKYRFLHQSEHSWVPDVAIFPEVILPTQAHVFGPARTGFYIPIWLQKDFGPWSTFGGAGYDINPGPANRNFTLAGWAVTRQVSKRLNLGVEVYHQTPQVIGAKSLTAFAAGAVYQLSQHFALMASAGPAVQTNKSAGQGVFYIALQFTK
jgi:hypothetical protein